MSLLYDEEKSHKALFLRSKAAFSTMLGQLFKNLARLCSRVHIIGWLLQIAVVLRFILIFHVFCGLAGEIQ